MASRIDPIDKDIDLLISDTLSPAARSELLANFARETLASAEETDAKALGTVPTHETFVDGSAGAAEETVRPDGTIVYVFDLILDLFAWIDEQLRMHSPVKTGRYRDSHKFFADGTEADPLHPPDGATEFTFVNAVPYARKVEYGESPQQPDGVYEAVTALASRRFGNIARIQFTWRGVVPGESVTPAARRTTHARAQNKSAVRFPAIIITVR